MTLLLIGSAWAGLFGIKDHDGDGIRDRDDRCMHRKETPNGFEDDDGCPDALSAIEIAVYIDGTYARNAPITILIGDEIETHKGTVQVRDLFPGTRIRALSAVGCLDGEVDFEVGRESRRVRMNLLPHTREITVQVRDPETGDPGRARVYWEGIAACGPQGPMRLQDEKVLSLGIGDHVVGLGRAGKEPFTFTVGPDTTTVVIPASSTVGMGRRTSKELEQVVYFDSNRSSLDAQGKAVVAEVVAWLTANPEARLRIEGHTDERAPETYNDALSAKRAQSVLLALIDSGIEPERLIVEALGEDEPAVTGFSEDVMAKNRRVVFVKL